MKKNSRRQFLQNSMALGSAAYLAPISNRPRDKHLPSHLEVRGAQQRARENSASGADPAPPMIFEDDFAQRTNLGWRIEQGKPDPANPLMTPAYPWDSASPCNSGTVVKDPIDGLWKSWTQSFPHVENFKRGQFYFRMTYAFSEDGRHWTRPMLEGFPSMGQERSNVLLDFFNFGRVGSVSVLVHPDAEPAKRYEMFLPVYFRNTTPWGRDTNSMPQVPGTPNGHPSGMYRFLSPDGIHWKPVEGPLKIETSDSIFISKEPDGPYVAYHKLSLPSPAGGYVPYDVGAGSQRILVRRESEDGTHWSPFDLQVIPDWHDAQDTQFMDLAPLRQGSGYAAIVAVFHCLNQMMDLQFAGSPDGKKWFRPIPRVPCVAVSPVGDPGGDLLYTTKNPIAEGDNLYLYYNAMTGLHGDVYGKVDEEYLQYGTLCRASWERGRLWAAVPAATGPTRATLTTRPVMGVAGKQLTINALTTEDGELTAELLAEGKPLGGFTEKDGNAFRGNAKLHVFSWKGGDRCPKDGVSVCFRFRRTRLYGFDWRA